MASSVGLRFALRATLTPFYPKRKLSPQTAVKLDVLELQAAPPEIERGSRGEDMISSPTRLRGIDAATRWSSSFVVFCMALLFAACGGGSGGAGTAAPVITTQPQSQTIATGSQAVFSVSVSPAGQASFQWYRNGAPIAGAIQTSYMLPAGTTTLADSGASFSVVVTNAGGSATSSAATLTVMDPVAITPGQSQTVTSGDAATFSIAATGSALSYQWRKNGTPIDGATGASYTTPATTLADSGTIFTVVVSNTVSSMTSGGLTLSVNADPEGLYTGILTLNVAQKALPVFAIITKDGTAAAYVTDHMSPAGINAPVGYSLHGLSVKPSGATFSSSFTALLPSGYLFSNGAPISTGTLSGTITPGSSITGTFTSNLDSGTFTLTAMTTDYNRPASLATLAGTYAYDSAYMANGMEQVFHTVSTANADGSGSASASNGCTSTSVSHSIPDPMHNVYETTAHFACSYSPDVVFTALSAFFPAGTGAGIIGPAAFASDTIVIITDDVGDQVAYMIVEAKQ
jgi:hypothetical protein